MKRRSFVTAAAAFLAAPSALFAKRSPHPGEPYVGLVILDDWMEDGGLTDAEWNEAAEKVEAARKKAAGPWRIVEQDEKGLVVLEREYGPNDFQGCVPLASVEFGRLKILDGKIQFTADFYCRSGKHEVVQMLDLADEPTLKRGDGKDIDFA